MANGFGESVGWRNESGEKLGESFLTVNSAHHTHKPLSDGVTASLSGNDRCRDNKRIPGPLPANTPAKCIRHYVLPTAASLLFLHQPLFPLATLLHFLVVPPTRITEKASSQSACQPSHIPLLQKTNDDLPFVATLTTLTSVSIPSRHLRMLNVLVRESRRESTAAQMNRHTSTSYRQSEWMPTSSCLRSD